MLRDLIKEGSIYTLANIATKGVSLLLVPFYTAYFAPADYGVMDVLAVFSGFVNVILSMQIGQGVGRYLADEKLSETQKHRIGSTGINLIILFYVIGTIFLFLTAHFWSVRLSDQHPISDTIFKLSISTIGINAVFYQLGIHLRFKRKTGVFAITNFLHALFNIGLTFVFVSQYQLGIEAIYYASMLVAPVIVLIQVFYIRNDYRLIIGLHETKMLLKFSIPLIPAAIAYIVLELTDRIFIKEYHSLTEVGIYGIGAKFASAVYLVVTGFSMALAPIVYENYALESTKLKLRKLIRFYFTAGAAAITILGLFSYETLVIFTNEEYYGAASVMPFLYTTVFFTGIGMFSVGIHISGKTHIGSLVVIASALLNVALNFLLIPEYSYLGAGISTAISLLVNNLVYYGLSCRYYDFYFPLSALARNSILLLGFSCLILVLHLIEMNYAYKLAFKVAVSLVMIFASLKFYQRLKSAG